MNTKSPRMRADIFLLIVLLLISVSGTPALTDDGEADHVDPSATSTDQSVADDQEDADAASTANKARFVRELQAGLPHQFPEDMTEGLWISSVPTGQHVFLFPAGAELADFQAWQAAPDSCANYLGQTPLYVNVDVGQYSLVFMHPPITDTDYKPRYISRPMPGPVGGTLRDRVFPFIATTKSTTYVSQGQYYWTQQRRVDYQGEPVTHIALFQREDQSTSSMLAGLPRERNFSFDIEMLSDLSDYGLEGVELTEEERAEAHEMLERGGVWGRDFGDAGWLHLEALPTGSRSTAMYPIEEDDATGQADQTPQPPKDDTPAPPNPSGWLSFAKSCIANGMHEQAKEYLEKILAESPDSPEAKEAQRMLDDMEEQPWYATTGSTHRQGVMLC